MFDPVNLVSGQVRQFVPFCVGLREKDSQDRKLKDGESIKQLQYFFLSDNPEELAHIKYEVPIELHWDGSTIKESCELLYDVKRRHLSVHASPSRPQQTQ
jgi:hypothetical protein